MTAIWKVLLLIVPLWLGATSTKPSDTTVFQHKIDAKKQPKALREVSKRLTGVQVLRASFRQQKLLKALRFPLRSTGTFLFARGIGIRWHLRHPFPAVFVITTHGITQTAAGQTTRISGKKKPIIMGFTRMFLAIFSGNIKQIHRHFQVYFQGTVQRWTLGLIPKHPLLRKIFRRIILRGKSTIERVNMFERSGDATHIAFFNVKIVPNQLTPKERRLFPRVRPSRPLHR